MNTFNVHTVETAPEGSKAQLEESVKAFGYIPNLHGTLAESPQLLEAYKTVGDLFTSSSFDNDEQTVVWQTINVEHECHYCVPAHTAIAHMMKVDPAITEALRNETPLESAKLETLRQTTLSLVRNRGNISSEEVAAFFAAGYEQRQLLDIILGISQKTISNYTNHVAQTPIDSGFQKFAWEKSAVVQ